MIQVDESKLYKSIGNQIRTLRKKEKISQSALGERLDLERTSITNIELGNQKPPLHTVYKVCAYFNLSLQDFLPKLDKVIFDDQSDKDKSNVEEITIGGKTEKVSPKTAALLRSLIKNTELPEKAASVYRKIEEEIMEDK